MSQSPLLLSLLSYAPKDGRVALEDFVTEALAFLLRREEALTEALVARLRGDGLSIDYASICTQERHESCRFDLLIGGPLGTKPSIIVENKVWSGFSGEALAGPREESVEHQLTRYLRSTSGLSIPPFVASLTVAPHPYEPPEDLADRWLGNCTWQDVLRLLEQERAAESDSVSGFMIEEFSTLLKEAGIVMSAVDPSVFEPNPGRKSLAALMDEAIREASSDQGGPWSSGTTSSGSDYLSVSMKRGGENCIGLAFWDPTGELALVVYRPWMTSHSVEINGDFEVDSVKFWGFPALVLDSQPLKDAESRYDQRRYLVEALNQLVQRVESTLGAASDLDS